MAKRKSDSFDYEAGTYTAKVLGSGTLICDVHKLPGGIGEIYDAMSTLARQLFMHGVKQKVADGMAGTDNAKEAYSGMKSIWAALVAGTWSSRGGISGTSLVAEAYAATTGKTPEAAAEALGKMSEDELKKIKKGATYQLEHARINYERKLAATETEKAA